jgi:hypothetical protein
MKAKRKRTKTPHQILSLVRRGARKPSKAVRRSERSVDADWLRSLSATMTEWSSSADRKAYD